jgi:hypothetical protein
LTFDAANVAIAVLSWLSGVAGAALVTRVYLRWHWHEITRAHAEIALCRQRLELLERKA